MGCHTWFSVPHTTGKNKIIKLAQDFLNSDSFLHTAGHKQMYQYAIDNEITEPCCELASFLLPDANPCDNNWVLYQDFNHYLVDAYNLETNAGIGYYDCGLQNIVGITRYSNEPRIGGYPDRIVRSYDDLLDFMSTGFDNSQGKHFDFYYDEDRYDKFMNDIKEFFINHPLGIIKFG